MYSNEKIASVLDFAALKPWYGADDIKYLAEYTKDMCIKSICVSSANVGDAVKFHPCVSAVIGFPYGNVAPDAKFRECACAINAGASELDVVVNYGRFLGEDRDIILLELAPICEYAHSEGVIVKAILETSYYTKSELTQACLECVYADVDYIKTSTGLVGGATVLDVQTILDATKGYTKIKASGGIKTYEDVKKFLDMGVQRIGSSSYTELCHG